MEPRDNGMDALLRRSMAGPVPKLGADFEQQVLRAVRRRSEPLDRYGRMVLCAYGAVSVVVSAVALRSQGVEWGVTAAVILVPLVVVAGISAMGRLARGEQVRPSR